MAYAITYSGTTTTPCAKVGSPTTIVNCASSVTLKTPRTMEVSLDDYDGDKGGRSRTTSGKDVRDRIRPRIRTVKMTWDAMSRADMAALINSLNSDTAFVTDSVVGQADISMGNYYYNSVSTLMYAIPKGYIVLEHVDPAYSSGERKGVFKVVSKTTPILNSLTGWWDGLTVTFEER